MWEELTEYQSIVEEKKVSDWCAGNISSVSPYARLFTLLHKYGAPAQIEFRRVETGRADDLKIIKKDDQQDVRLKLPNWQFGAQNQSSMFVVRLKSFLSQYKSRI